ncbi:DNA polymerase III subunit epsilon [Clostridiaceae bacterium]|nr:DNA polymerase III subunit epsilon [Clostridiaceae bacterium]
MLGERCGRKLEKYTPDYVVFDLETTGISPMKDDIIELSAVKVRGGQAVGEFSQLVNPLRPIPRQASMVNGITDGMVADAPPLDAVFGAFLDFIGNDILVGHNIHTFDMKFIYRAAGDFYGRILDNDYIDTLPLSRSCLPGLSHHRLTDLAEYYHIPTDGAHRALNDCHMNRLVFEAIGKELRGAGRTLRLCPRCGQTLKRRSGRYGAFWGCSGFPACRYTEH